MIPLRMALVLLCVAACSRNRDADEKALAGDLRAFDEEVESVVRASPDAAGVAKAEGIVAARAPALHTRLLALQGATLSPSASMDLVQVCAGDNHSASLNARGYVYNAVLKTNPPLRTRAEKLALSICEVCETPSNDACAALRQNHPRSERTEDPPTQTPPKTIVRAVGGSGPLPDA
jgi:hypothetical protein